MAYLGGWSRNKICLKEEAILATEYMQADQEKACTDKAEVKQIGHKSIVISSEALVSETC